VEVSIHGIMKEKKRDEGTFLWALVL